MSDNAVAKKPGFIQRAKRFFRDVAGEMKKIVWPSKTQTINNTGIVIGVVIIAAIFVGAFDFVIGWMLDLFVGIL